MSKVYTQRFLLSKGEGVLASYEVPENKRAVIRNVICQTNAPQQGYHLYAHGYYMWFYSSPVAFAHDTFETRLVLYERETLSVQTFGAGSSVGVFGYLFDDPEGKPAETKPIAPQRPVAGPLSPADTAS